jgi:hypothetical protein
MPLVIVFILIVLVALILIARSRRTPTAPVAYPAVQPGSAVSSGPSRSTQNVEEALALLATCVHPQGAGDLRTVVQVRVTDHVPADWHFDLDQGTCSLGMGLAADPRLTLTASTQSWLELAAKRLSFAGAAMNGRVQSEGDTAILMRLDNEFSGSPDPSRLASAPATRQPALGEPTSANILEAIKAANVAPNASPAERRAAIVEALRSNLSAGADVRISTEESISAESLPSAFSVRAAHLSTDVRAAVRQALDDLPPGATREQKMAAIRAAVQQVPNASHIIAMLDAQGSGHAGGIRGELVGHLFEGLLESLLGDG